MTAPKTGDGTSGATDMPGRSGPAATLMPALTVTISLLGLCLLWSLAAHLWQSRALPPPGQVWQVLLRETASGEDRKSVV